MTAVASTPAVADVARRLDQAARDAVPVDQSVVAEAVSDVEDAYAVQRALVALRVERGHDQIGVKLGFTSRAKMRQMGVDQLIWGQLTADMVVDDGGELPLDRFIHPRVEPEIAFLLGGELGGEVSAQTAASAVAAVAPALEIIDSRYVDFRFSLPGVVADNASSAGVVVGPWCSPDRDLSNLGILLQMGGRLVHGGSSAAILGHPLRSLVAAARLVGADEPLPAGSIVLAGAATPAEALRPGVTVTAEVAELGVVALHVSSPATRSDEEVAGRE